MANQPGSTPPPAVFGPPDDPRPWVRHANAIAARIADGTYKPGQWLPSMTVIGEKLGAAKTDLERAVYEACASGLITRVPRVGCYPGTAAPPPGRPAKPPRRPKPPKARQGAPADPLDESWITIAEFAAQFRLSKMTAYRAVYNGDIEGVVRIGNSYRIPQSAAHAYRAAHLFSDAQPGQHPQHAGRAYPTTQESE